MSDRTQECPVCENVWAPNPQQDVDADAKCPNCRGADEDEGGVPWL